MSIGSVALRPLDFMLPWETLSSFHCSTPMPGKKPVIEVRGARVNNLKNVDVDVPRDSFVVITGLSGSGKSAFAFDTLYPEV